jgi:serine/threonine-protein kinase
LDGRSDLYALGAILFETLTGKLPYEADTPMGIAIKHIVEPVPRILETNPRLPTACETIVSRAMAKDRAERFPNARTMAAMLESVARTGGASISPATAPSIEDKSLEPVVTQVKPTATPTLVTPPPKTTPAPAPASASPTAIPVWVWMVGGVLGIILFAFVGFLGFNLLNQAAPTAAPSSTFAPTAVTPVATQTSAPPTTGPATPQPQNTQAPTVAPPATVPPPTATLAPPTATAGPAARITNVSVSGDQYLVDFTVSGYDYGLPGPHVHFFFDTVTPEQAGVPGAGPWELYGGPSPYTTTNTLKVSARGLAQNLCILVANPNHSIILNTGNCVPLPP